MGMVEGFVLTLVAGVMMGGNLVPLKWMKIWKWENFWLVYSLMSLLVVPAALGFLLLPGLGAVYASVSRHIPICIKEGAASARVTGLK